jgi:hypothetical protein
MKHALSAAGRAAIAKAAKKRWAKVRAQAKKVAVVNNGGVGGGMMFTDVTTSIGYSIRTSRGRIS